MMRQNYSRIIVLSIFELLVVVSLTNAIQITSVDVMENDWYSFRCEYDAQRDRRKTQELAVHIQDCSVTTYIATNKDQVSKAVAVVFGKYSAQEDETKVLMSNRPPPLFYESKDNPFVKNGLVRIVSGDENQITVQVNATNATSSPNCIICSQVAQYRDLEATKKESLTIRRSPTVSATVNGVAQSATSPPIPVKTNDPVTITCTASGPDQLSVKLILNNREIASQAGKSLTHVIPKAGRDSAGLYKCQAASNLPLLVERGQSTGTLDFVLAVKFAPEFEVSEIVRYTQIGSSENIRIRVRSYPAAKLICSPNSEIPIRESYKNDLFVNEFDLTLSNLDSVKKESTFECTATNDVGQHQIQIRLTAKAPTPEILSGPDTTWSNSYTLKWQHDVNATIDHYLVEIAYKNNEDNSVVNKTEVKFSPTVQKGAVALVDGEAKNGKLVHSGVLLNLQDDSNHDIRLRSCNEHGCSEYSPSISVKTPAKSSLNYNDPRNPTKETNSMKQASTIAPRSLAAHLSGLLVTWSLLKAGMKRL